MFSGLVQGTGKIRVLDRQAETINLTVAPTVADVMDQLAIGDSIAINGTCLTVVTMGPDEFQVTLMPQTFEKTTFKDLRVGDLVNLERSLTVGARLEGHIVTGHVDEVVTVRDVQKMKTRLKCGLTFRPG